MQTILYLVRHADSAYTPGRERERGLSDQGFEDVHRVQELLRNEEMDAFYSSPYRRAVQTVNEAALAAGKQLVLVEDLRERSLAEEHFCVKGEHFQDMKKRLYDNFDDAYPGGESSAEAQRRGVQAILGILDRHAGHQVVVGTHGDIMTLILNHFDRSYGYDFWRSTSMPDIYKLEFEAQQLKRVTRCWDSGKPYDLNTEVLSG
ncbi:histidine phosphatase family protein [Paenibacillus sp. SAF-054]|uniref:histidine phosphatase family protein n=1 Tax=unclassified Paenibacillus TaxID=185978 RepID=UPI003F81C0F8